MLRWLLLACLAASPVSAEPVIRGLDHIPIAVADLDRAQADFEALGFVLKPGRPHANGLRNVHAKFADGTEIELITAPAATDELTAEYVAWLKSGDGAPFAGFHAPDLNDLASRISDLGSPLTLADGLAVLPAPSLLHHLFFGRRQRSPTDRPEHFAHPNTAFGLVAVWLAEDPLTRAFFRMLEVSPEEAPRCAPIGSDASRLALPEGEIVYVRTTAARPILAATVAVRSLETARQLLAKNRVRVDGTCRPDSLWVGPAAAHGLWLEFRQQPAPL